MRQFHLRSVSLRNHMFSRDFRVVVTYFSLRVFSWKEHCWTPTELSQSEVIWNLQMEKAVHFYFMCKLIELLDTVFFVLRKKNRQITFLHIYHHAIMPVCSWIGCRFLPNGHGTLLGVINAFVHVIMYTYYMLSSIGPHMNKYLWWKKHLTLLQLIQFSIIVSHSLQILFNGCDYPKPIAFLLVLNGIVFIYMFGSFYVHSYIKQDKLKAAFTAKAVDNGAAKNKPEWYVKLPIRLPHSVLLQSSVSLTKGVVYLHWLLKMVLTCMPEIRRCVSCLKMSRFSFYLLSIHFNHFLQKFYYTPSTYVEENSIREIKLFFSNQKETS